MTEKPPHQLLLSQLLCCDYMCDDSSTMQSQQAAESAHDAHGSPHAVPEVLLSSLQVTARIPALLACLLYKSATRKQTFRRKELEKRTTNPWDFS
jgi:hypothetical protein